jgi:hypothetical protein
MDGRGRWMDNVLHGPGLALALIRGGASQAYADGRERTPAPANG